MLYLVGLGLGDPTDITVKGLEVVRRVDVVYLESYTSILCGENYHESLEKFYGRSVLIADREFVETDDNQIITDAKTKTVALLVVGDPFGATTHTDMVIRAKKQGIDVKVIHNASIMNAVAACGLQLYNFGETVSIPLWEENWQPTSFIEKIQRNKSNGLHTLCLLDIKVKEKTIEAIIKGKNEYLPPRFMSAATAASQIMEAVRILSAESETKDNYHELVDGLAIGMARVGSETQSIHVTKLREMSSCDLGEPLHSLVIPGKMHPLEEEYISLLKQ